MDDLQYLCYSFHCINQDPNRNKIRPIAFSVLSLLIHHLYPLYDEHDFFKSTSKDWFPCLDSWSGLCV